MKQSRGTTLNAKQQMPWNRDSEMRLHLCASVVRTLAELDERDRLKAAAKREARKKAK